jgi:hypothetical protein
MEQVFLQCGNAAAIIQPALRLFDDGQQSRLLVWLQRIQ